MDVKLTDLGIAAVEKNPACVIDTMALGQIPRLSTTHENANTVSCIAAEQIVAAGRRFHEVYVAPQDTAENVRRKTKDIKEDEVVILVHHQNINRSKAKTELYAPDTWAEITNILSCYQGRLVNVLLEKN